MWTGIGAAIVNATLGIVAVAVLWMPAAGASGHWTSTVKAGLLTALAALHGGVTIDGTDTTFVPLGLTLLAAFTTWRAGVSLADTAAELDEGDPIRLAVAGAAQAATFAVACLILVPYAELGTSSAPFLGVGIGALVLISATGGLAFARRSAVGPAISALVPEWVGRALRAGTAAAFVPLILASGLVAGALVVHHTRVEDLSLRVGGGWAGVPVLVLGVLAAPNAIVAGAAYLLGPGFSVGSGGVTLTTGAHGVMPAFPLLGALPDGPAVTAVRIAGLAAPILAGLVVVRVSQTGAIRRVPLLGWLRTAAAGAVVAGVLLAVLAWLGGGSIGGGALSGVGASASRLGLQLGGELLGVAIPVVLLIAGWQRLRDLRWARAAMSSTDKASPADKVSPADKASQADNVSPADNVNAPADHDADDETDENEDADGDGDMAEAPDQPAEAHSRAG